MSNKNYNKMSEKSAKETVVETAPVTENSKQAKEEPVYGVVTNCTRLNVRSKPNIKANVVSIVEKETKFIINKKESTKEFYSVSSIDEKIKGFCMRDYITIEQ